MRLKYIGKSATGGDLYQLKARMQNDPHASQPSRCPVCGGYLSVRYGRYKPHQVPGSLQREPPCPMSGKDAVPAGSPAYTQLVEAATQKLNQQRLDGKRK